ncbi:MAG: hypothetical protein RRA45_10310 [Saccharolobus sp.]|jgi:hypothetical protein|uniref:hypothetical protein n=1 Tax=Saccharolobus sp. TaxID=2100761 RepID=UPI0028CCD909|nr:hypothetical protein [Saccharolobus sp.]MDT7862589.1 hypothetical protein [Saccharolobus sp.]
MTKLCFEVKREVNGSSKLIMLNRNIFKKIIGNNLYLKVLLYPDFREIGVSKSYYYYILGKLNKLNLINNGKINFRVIVSYIYDDKLQTIKIDPIFILLSKNMLCIIDLRRRCSIDDKVVEDLKIREVTKERIKRALSQIIKQYLEVGIANVE